MKQYEIQLPVTFKAGRFRLTQEQFRRRQYVVRLLDARELIVEPMTEISFKRGEVIETDLEMPKTLAAAVVPVAQSDAPPPEEPRAQPPASDALLDQDAAVAQESPRRRNRRASE